MLALAFRRKYDNMTQPENTCRSILFLLSLVVLGIFEGLSEAALVHQEQHQQPYQSGYQQSYAQNTFDRDQRKPAKLTSHVPYDEVDGLGNRVVEKFDHRYPDGSYEFRYELSDGTARYERGYFLKIDKLKELVVVGYYSYRMPNNQYVTVFYNADRNGYRQNQAFSREAYPNLPRTIEVPEAEHETSARTTNKPSYLTASTTKRSRL
ncbi:uncharacterized protein LOC106087974 [Stomoxys calcitrans]|uniref:Larval cuticle protein 16/17 n=1 Tax=Stomoxys calcitrans TaxID=35570 RepID=A0A1I8PW80_STOCA|nr:uncharacterized protein LOC106087974 [Stomoxys calcitrans]